MKKEIEDIIRILEFLISEDCTDTQLTYVDYIENAIEIIKTIKNAEMSNSRLIEICEAERDGRLLLMPCKVGDMVYVLIRTFVENKNKLVWSIDTRIIDELNSNRLNSNTMVSKKPFELHFYPSEIGKSVFLTQAEAEKALAERRGK